MATYDKRSGTNPGIPWQVLPIQISNVLTADAPPVLGGNVTAADVWTIAAIGKDEEVYAEILRDTAAGATSTITLATVSGDTQTLCASLDLNATGRLICDGSTGSTTAAPLVIRTAAACNLAITFANTNAAQVFRVMVYRRPVGGAKPFVYVTG